MLGYAVLFMYFASSLLAYLEKFLGKYNLLVYLLFGAVLIILASTKEVGIDPDSSAYEMAFLTNESYEEDNNIEYSFVLISQFVMLFSNDVHFLFLFYAFFGVSLKFIAFRQLDESWFLPVVAYISYFYIFHELMQIRTGIMSGFFLLSMKPMCEGKRLQALLFMLAGFFFHYSALALLPLLFLSSKIMTVTGKALWALLIPFGYFLYLHGLPFLLEMSTNLPYIGNKLAVYQWGTQMGTASDAVNVFNPLQLVMIALYYYLLYFHDGIVEQNKAFPLLLKIFGLGIIAYPALSSFPVMAERFQLLFLTASIPLFPLLEYTVKPRWAGITLVVLVAFAFINIAMPSINFSIFWKSARMR